MINHLKTHRFVSSIALWGRSMGAATVLLTASKDPSISAIVCDSAYADLKMLVTDLGKDKTKLPGFLLSAAISLVKSSVK